MDSITKSVPKTNEFKQILNNTVVISRFIMVSSLKLSIVLHTPLSKNESIAYNWDIIVEGAFLCLLKPHLNCIINYNYQR